MHREVKMNIIIVNIPENKTKMFQDIKTVKTFDNFFKLIFNSGKVISFDWNNYDFFVHN